MLTSPLAALAIAAALSSGPVIDLPPHALEPNAERGFDRYFTHDELETIVDAGGLTREWLDLYRSRRDVGPTERTFRGVGNDVEQWRWLVEIWFAPADVERALDIMACESGGNPNAKNPTSTASGLFQHLRAWWSGEWGTHGPFDPFDPAESVEAAAYLRYDTPGGWSHWNPSRHCWG